MFNKVNFASIHIITLPDKICERFVIITTTIILPFLPQPTAIDKSFKNIV